MFSRKTVRRPFLGISRPISMSHPDRKDRELMKTLIESLDDFNNFESKEESEKRVKALQSIECHVKEWIRNVMSDGFPSRCQLNFGGKLIDFGSYRLGVHSSGTDIDAVVVAPQGVYHTDFFTSFKEMLAQDPETTELHTVQQAYVSLIKLKYSGIEMDLLFADLNSETVPENLNFTDDLLLKDLKMGALKSFNGPRVAEKLLKLVPNRKEFRLTLRAIKLWSKNHGVYSSSMGLFGGITWAILVARTCQLFPNACASKLIKEVFDIFSTWKWPAPIILDHIKEYPEMAAISSSIWNPEKRCWQGLDRMPIITPAFPQQNSAHNATRFTVSVIQEEMKEASSICKSIRKGTANWMDLFEEVNFFSRYNHFIALAMAAPTKESDLIYAGFFESRFRQLIQLLESCEDIKVVHINPKKIKPSPNAQFNFDKNNNMKSVWFLGMEFTKNVESLDLPRRIDQFKERVEKQAKLVKEIGPDSTVQTDVFYVKHSDLVDVIQESELQRGRLLKKQSPAQETETSIRRKRQFDNEKLVNPTPEEPLMKKSRMDIVDSPTVNSLMSHLKQQSSKH